MSKAHRFKAGDAFTIECARKGGAAGPFQPGSAKARAAGRKSRLVSSWGYVPLRPQGVRARRLELIRQAAGRKAHG